MQRVCVGVCVRERERERESENGNHCLYEFDVTRKSGEGERKIHSPNLSLS